MRLLFAAMMAASLCLMVSPAQTQEPGSTGMPPQDPRVFREPFTLRVRVDKSHYYEEHYEKRIPYVSDNDVYLFTGENFGVNLTSKDDGAVEVSFQPDIKKADVWFSLAQPKELGGAAMMLTIQNRIKQRLQVDGLMTVPGKQGTFKTSILPIEAGLSDFESWPHPIVQLVVRNFRLSESQIGKKH